MSRLVDQLYSVAADRDVNRLKFFVAFSLLEFALKECIRLKRGRFASPNWDEFARREPDLRLSTDPATADAVRYVLAEPPDVERVLNGRAVFQAEELLGVGNGAICEALKRIRNNLFHGGKEPYTKRDERLVGAGLQIIEGFLSVHDDLKAAFLSGG